MMVDGWNSVMQADINHGWMSCRQPVMEDGWNGVMKPASDIKCVARMCHACS
jgi:hypothetical protein